MRAELETPPYDAALQRLTEAVVQGREFYMFWNHAQWVRVIEARTQDLSVSIPSFSGQALENFFLNGRRPACSASTCRRRGWSEPYDFLRYAAIDARA